MDGATRPRGPRRALRTALRIALVLALLVLIGLNAAKRAPAIAAALAPAPTPAAPIAGASTAATPVAVPTGAAETPEPGTTTPAATATEASGGGAATDGGTTTAGGGTSAGGSTGGGTSGGGTAAKPTTRPSVTAQPAAVITALYADGDADCLPKPSDAPGAQAPENPDVTVHWRSTGAVGDAWFGVGTSDAKASPYSTVHQSDSITLTFPCSEASQRYTVTVQSPGGGLVSRSITVRNTGTVG